MAVALAVCAGLSLLYWLYMAYTAVRTRAVPEIVPQPDRRKDWPPLSVIVPARNEADDLAGAAATLLAQDYPSLEIVLVDDRSTDATGTIVDDLASADDRARAVHVTKLPGGWLGKVHALKEGLGVAGGELLLFTDADVHFAPGALRMAVDYMTRQRLDHLAGFPRLRPAGLLLGMMLAAFLRQFIAVTRPWKVADASSRAFIGIGAFNLVRREAFLAAGGFDWLRMEIGDDAALGLMMKRAGARCGVAAMTRQISLYWHRTIAQAVRGAEKGWSSLCRFSVARTVVLGLAMTVLETAPVWGPALLLHPRTRPAGWIGAGIAAACAAGPLLMARWAHQRPAAQLLSIVAAPINFAVMIRTAWLGHRRGGATWRGTVYPTAALREGMRLRFP